MNETLYTGANAIAKRLGVDRKTVLKWIRDEGLPAFKTGDQKNNTWWCLESSISRWLKTFEKKHVNR